MLVGAAAERHALETIRAGCVDAVDLGGRTDLFDLAALARAAVGAVGNDTGPMHLAAHLGCPTLMLLSDASPAQLAEPQLDNVSVLKRADMADLGVDEVAAALRLR